MKTSTAGAIGGLVGGAVTSGVMLIGHDAGLLQRTLAHDSQDWIDRRFHTRERMGAGGTALIEQIAHYGASAGFGSTYGGFRPLVPFLPGIAAGALFGAGMYALGVAGVMPELGITQGERNAPPGVARERLAVHLLFGAILGVVTDILRDKPGRPPRLSGGNTRPT